MVDDDRSRAAQHRGVVRLHGRREMRQPVERRERERAVLHALERRDCRDVNGGMRIVDEAQETSGVARHCRDAQEARAFETLPPTRRAAVGADDPRPQVVLERSGELPPAFARHARRPAHQGIDRQWDGKTCQSDEDTRQWSRSRRPASHRGVDCLAARIEARAPTQPEPTVQDDQHDERREQATLHDRDDDEKMAGTHLPTHRRIFSSATRRLMGFTM